MRARQSDLSYVISYSFRLANWLSATREEFQSWKLYLGIMHISLSLSLSLTLTMWSVPLASTDTVASKYIIQSQGYTLIKNIFIKTYHHYGTI